MKLPILLTALLLSASPVQANEELDIKFMKFIDPCYESDAARKTCFAASNFQSVLTGFSIICALWDDKEITEDGMIKSIEKIRERLADPFIEEGMLAWNIAVKNILDFHPNYPIRPVQ